MASDTLVVERPQHMRALAKAEHFRLGRARLKDAVAILPSAAGFKRVVELLEQPPEEIMSLEIEPLLQWVHRVGRSHARSILKYADPIGPITENRRISELSERQRLVLAGHLYRTYVSRTQYADRVRDLQYATEAIA